MSKKGSNFSLIFICLLHYFLFMCSSIADIFGYTSISSSRAPDATIGRDRISLAIRPALAEDLTEEDSVDIQTNPKRVTICHVPHADPKNRHTISAGTYSDSEHVHEYSNYLRPTIFLTQHS
jgi:hypothetical protein